MLKKYLVIMGMMSLLFIIGCEKEEVFGPAAEIKIEKESCFFTNDCLSIRSSDSGRTVDPDLYVEMVKNYFISNPHEKNKTENKYGIPVWDFTTTSNVDGGVLVSLPMTKVNKNYTEAVLLILIDNNLELGFNVIERKKVHQYQKKNKNKPKQDEISKELALIQLLIADKTIFDNSDCSLLDLLVSISSNSRVVESSRTDECYWSWESDEDCWSIEVYGTDGNPIGDPHIECETTYDYEIVCNGPSVPPNDPGDGTSGNGGGSTGGGNDPDPIEIEDIIISTLPPCLNSVYLDVKNIQNGEIKNVLDKLNEVILLQDGPLSNIDSRLQYRWKLEEGNCSNFNSIACTLPSASWITTIIDASQNQNSSDLSIAKTIMHEAFHAYLIFQERQRGVFENEYGVLINSYTERYSEGLNAAHHEFFVQENIVDQIAQALYQYAGSKGYTTGSNAIDLEYCKKLAWGGLSETSVFLAKSLSEKSAIQNVTEQERTGNNTKTQKACS